MKKELEDLLKHHGVKGMHWGVHRTNTSSSGSNSDEKKKKDNRGKLAKTLDSMKRERRWHKVLKEMDKLSTDDINAVSSRVKLENNLKRLSKSKVGKPKDKEDYLQRQNMSNDELKRKVTRLRAKENLYKSVKDASKEQRELGQKIVNVGKSLSIKYTLNKTLSKQDIFKTISNPGESAKNAKGDLQKAIIDKLSEKKK